MRLLLGSEEHTSELQSPCNLVCVFLLDRKSTRLNSSHLVISYAVFCLKKKRNCTSSSRRSPRTRHCAACPAPTPRTSAFRTLFFFFNDTATPEIYTLSLPAALPI